MPLVDDIDWGLSLFFFHKTVFFNNIKEKWMFNDSFP